MQPNGDLHLGLTRTCSFFVCGRRACCAQVALATVVFADTMDALHRAAAEMPAEMMAMSRSSFGIPNAPTPGSMCAHLPVAMVVLVVWPELFDPVAHACAQLARGVPRAAIAGSRPPRHIIGSVVCVERLALGGRQGWRLVLAALPQFADAGL